MSHSVESEGEQTGGLYAIVPVLFITERVCPTNLCSDLSDVAIASVTGRVRVSRWCVLHVVLSGNPGQIARQLRVDGRILGSLGEDCGAYCIPREFKCRTALMGRF